MKNKLFLSSVLLGLSISACGASNETPEEDNTNKVTIVVEDLVENNQGLNSIIKKKQKAFETAHPEIIVKHNAVSETDFTTQLKYVKQTFDVNSASTPTMLMVNTNEFARQLYDDGYTKVLTGFKDSDYVNQINQEILNGYTFNGEVVGFPVEIETPMLGFNKSILEKRKDQLAAINQDYQNLTINTWDDYKAIVNALTYTENTKTIYGMGVTAADYYQSFGVWATANGFDAITQNSNGTISINFKENESMKQTIMLFNDLVDSGAIMKNGIDARSADYFNYIWTGRLASFTYYPQWANWFLNSGNMSIADVDVYNFPKGTHATNDTKTNTIYTKGYVISKKASDAQVNACIEYLKFMYSKEVWEEKVEFAYENYCDFVTFPALTSVNLDLVYQNIDETTGNDHYSKAIKNSLSNGYVGNINSVAYTLEIRNKLSDLFQYDGDLTGLTSMLETLENTTKSNWLNAYNDSKGQ